MCLQLHLEEWGACGSLHTEALVLPLAPVLRCSVRVHELEDMHDVIIVWPDRAAA
jgi:hypothetical protein